MWELTKESKSKFCRYTVYNLVKKCGKTEQTKFKIPRSFQGQSYTATNYRQGQGKVNKAETGQNKRRGKITGGRKTEDIWKTTNIYSVNKRVKERKVKKLR
jgi:hypothetical protein